MIRTCKSIVKKGLRTAAGWRLKYFPVSQPTAERWAERIKHWPALFDDSLGSRTVTLGHGVQMQVGIVDHIERQLWFQKEWDRPVKFVLESLLNPGDTYIDLGANIGYFTLLASRLVGPAGVVVAAEPSIRALRKLTYHLWLNRCKNVLLMSCAVGPEWSRGELGLATESNIGGSAILAGNQHQLATEPVWIAPLDDLVQGLAVHPKLIKLDLEGFEWAALTGTQRIISRCHPWIVCEVTERLLRKFGASTMQLFELLQNFGYRPYRLLTGISACHWEPVTGSVCTTIDQLDVLFVPPDGDLAVINTP